MGRRGKLDSGVIEMYRDGLLACGEISKRYGVSRTAVWSYLRRNGVDTSKQMIEVSCDLCGKRVKRPRCQVRNANHHFCGHACYFEFVRNDGYQENRNGQRIGRAVASGYVRLEDGWVIHHVDGNTFNNAEDNLWVFKSHAEHMRYHRCGKSLAFVIEHGRWEEVEKS